VTLFWHQSRNVIKNIDIKEFHKADAATRMGPPSVTSKIYDTVC